MTLRQRITFAWYVVDRFEATLLFVVLCVILLAENFDWFQPRALYVLLGVYVERLYRLYRQLLNAAKR